jgi:hypothetical protein
MKHALDEPSHTAAVDAWLARSVDHDSSVDIVRLFHAALTAIWDCAVTTLGPVTLTAIAERVLHSAGERYTFLSVIDRRPNGDARAIERLCERLVAVPRDALIEGLRYGMIEMLTVIGALTAEVLSRDLHVVLETITPGSEPGSESRLPADLPVRPGAASDKVRS